MRSLIPFDGLFGNTVLDHFFDDDMPTVYQDYTAVPKVDIEDKKDHYEITCDMPGFKKEEIHISYENGILSLGAKKEDKKDADDTRKTCDQQTFGHRHYLYCGKAATTPLNLEP